ncbi:MAG: BREX system P-loop protein BrxC [Desulfobacterales bacterium]|nr:BREX system P-loop protein BrxC [Desulfobacterales bacterium]MBF0397872.1 BREX system P-loop protein BrxC [Desulfobacterales bacterium]
MKIKDILTINLSEDIKNVIDLEDISEAEIQSEIENYIITDGLAKEYSDFASKFSSNILETGVWISGFYGSGKSYFGKLLGYLLSNRSILGTPARDRILQRFTGINDEALIKNSLARLNNETCRVVFLDVAKQDTKKGLAYTLFRNFLKSLELPENEHGVFLYQLMINCKQSNVYKFINSNLNKNWSDIKNKLIEYTKATKAIFIQQGNNEDDYNNLLTTIRRNIDQFDASCLKDELTNYLQTAKGEKIIFLFDEASEAINQNKFNLLDLEGISESLSALGGKVWTIAIAQEKLDDVIRGSNISRAQLTKVTDRFKTKIHLEATEIDVIIRNRLLKKKDDAIKQLTNHYQNNSGKINDHAALNAAGLTKTDSSDTYATYYPFYSYQFNLMQNFLFGTKGYASPKVAARGMIITTYDILKRGLQENELFETASGWQIVKQAQPQPPVRLVNRYDNAERILRENKSDISGRKLLETINFLSEAEVVPTTLPNIIKSFISSPKNFHQMQDVIKKALDDLVEAKILLFSNHTYRITSDIEQRLLDEMNAFAVQSFVKKKQIVYVYKSSQFITALSRITDNSLQYDFYISTDNDDELTNPSLKQLKIKLKSLYSISDDRTADIEKLKVNHQNDKDLICLIPDNSSFQEIDRLIDEIERITYLEQKYNNPQSEEGRVLISFLTTKSEKEKRLKELIEQSLQKADSVYLFNIFQLNKDNFQSVLQNQQRQMIQNVYTKRLSSQLSDDVAAKVIKEGIDTKLQSYFNGADFKFFDNQGNFIGENLKAVEEILYKIRNTFVEGNIIASDLQQPPTGFTFGTVISTIAALMRGGRIIAKSGGFEKFSWRDSGVSDIFAKATAFRKTSFKAIAKSLSAKQKDEIVKALQDLKCEEHINKKIDWNTNDFDLVSAVQELAKHFCNEVNSMSKQNKDFNTLFKNIEALKDKLSEFIGAVSESNYIEKAEFFLNNQSEYKTAVQSIEKVKKFIHNNLPKLLNWKLFAENVNDELKKAAKTDDAIIQLIAEFKSLYDNEIVKNFSAIQNKAQQIKDKYFNLMQNAAFDMSEKYSQLKLDAEAVIKEIHALPAGLNDEALNKVNLLLQFASQRTQTKIELDYDVKDKNSRFTYSEILSYIDLFNSKKTDLEILRSSLIKTEPAKEDEEQPVSEETKIFITHFPAKKLKIVEYKRWLRHELQKIAGARENDEIEVIYEKL